MIVRAAIALLAASALPPAALAGQPKDYAYVFLQGRLTDSATGRPQVRAAVRLSTEAATYEALSDHRGVFTFEKLPLGPFELRITTPEGRVIRGIQRGNPDDPGDTRFTLKLGQGYGVAVHIETTGERTTVHVPEPGTKWPKLWKELAIFVAAAGALAL